MSLQLGEFFTLSPSSVCNDFEGRAGGAAFEGIQNYPQH